MLKSCLPRIKRPQPAWLRTIGNPARDIATGLVTFLLMLLVIVALSPQSQSGPASPLAAMPFGDVGVQILSFSGQQIAILTLAMMFALISVFVRRSARHLRCITAPSAHKDWG